MELFHVLNRGVDKRNIFMNDKDYFRFLHNMYEFNDIEISASSSAYRFKILGFASLKTEKGDREPLVDIHAFCLMPNHYHLLISPKVENGISRFMKKLNMGYANYFNLKYKRSGALFQGRYKSILVEDESHFLHLPYYIHMNPLDLYSPEWRGYKIKNSAKALGFLENYKWSSYLDYIGIKNCSSVLNKNFLSDVLGDARTYKTNMAEFLREMKANFINDLGKLTLE